MFGREPCTGQAFKRHNSILILSHLCSCWHAMPAPRGSGAAPTSRPTSPTCRREPKCPGLDSKPTTKSSKLMPRGLQPFSPRSPHGTGPGTQQVPSECIKCKKQHTLIRPSYWTPCPVLLPRPGDQTHSPAPRQPGFDGSRPRGWEERWCSG